MPVDNFNAQSGAEEQEVPVSPEVLKLVRQNGGNDHRTLGGAIANLYVTHFEAGLVSPIDPGEDFRIQEATNATLKDFHAAQDANRFAMKALQDRESKVRNMIKGAQQDLETELLTRAPVLNDAWAFWQDDVPTYKRRMETMEMGDPRRVEMLKEKLEHCLSGNAAPELDLCMKIIDLLEKKRDSQTDPDTDFGDVASRFMDKISHGQTSALATIIESEHAFDYRSDIRAIEQLQRQAGAERAILNAGTARLGTSRLGVNTVLGMN